MVIFIYSRSFQRKEDVSITILDLKSNEKPFMDMKEAKEFLILSHFIAGLDIHTLWKLRAYEVIINLKTHAIEKKEIPIIDCKLAQKRLDEIGV